LPNGGQISVFLKKLDSIAEIEIADTGPGLSASDSEQCFDLRFTTGSHRYGLGLYIARKVIEKHRGTLALRSESGQGSQALIHLPIGNPEPDWDDERALVLALESLSDSIASRKLEIDTYRATSALSHEKMLAQLANLFGHLGASTIQFLENSLANIRRLLVPLSDQMTGEAADHIRFILDKCAYCGVLLGNVRALNPDLTLRPVPLDLNQIASKVVQLMTWRVQSGTQLHLVRFPSLPRVYADALLIAVALLNLLRNALDAAGQNGRVGVQTLSTDDVVIVRFINTGNTIPPSDDVRARIFDLDYTTRPGRAFGLGLYVAQSIVARHNGSITLLDMPQSRVRLELALPIKRMREVQRTST
jgi:signal transduction histidine kinase